MFVYRATIIKWMVDAVNPTEYLEDDETFDLGLFSNKKKAINALVDVCDSEIEWRIKCGDKICVQVYHCDEFDISGRFELYGRIIWMKGKVEKIKVN